MSSIETKNTTDIQNSIASLNATVAALMTEVARLSNPSRPHHVMKTSIPLLPMQQAQSVRPRLSHVPHQKGRRPYHDMYRPELDTQKQEHVRASIPLSTLLQVDEEVTFFVLTGKDAQGQPTRTTAVSIFDGTNLKVTKCDLANSLVGTQTQKPGEILYKFIEELKNGGHIKRTFSVAPWKLCFVKRNGVELTLDQLRTNLSQSQ
jgi:hypothetical protein